MEFFLLLLVLGFINIILILFGIYKAFKISKLLGISSLFVPYLATSLAIACIFKQEEKIKNIVQKLSNKG
jgi:hypothetical protein